MITEKRIKRGEVYLADLSGTVGSEQSGVRPVLIVSNDVGNKFSNTCVICPVTSKIKAKLPTHVSLTRDEHGMKVDSTVLAEQIKAIDKTRLINRLTVLDKGTMKKIESALLMCLAIDA